MNSPILIDESSENVDSSPFLCDRDVRIARESEYRSKIRLLDARVVYAKELLRLILPLARGYAAKHNVKINFEFIAEVEEFLAAEEAI